MYQNTDIRLQAHRGAMLLAPENTMAAFRLAAKMGYDLIELDPRFTKDGVCVLMHDPYINRTARRAGQILGEEKQYICDMDFAQFAEIEVGSWFAEEFAGEPVPTLPQALALARENHIGIRLDRKFEIEQFPQIFDLVERYGQGVDISIGNCDLNALRIFAEHFPTAAVNYDGPYSEEAMQVLHTFSAGREVNVWVCPENNPETAWCHFPKLNQTIADGIHRHGFGLGIWEIDTEEQVQQVLPFAPQIMETRGGIVPQK